jgi:hypothetical protein
VRVAMVRRRVKDRWPVNRRNSGEEPDIVALCILLQFSMWYKLVWNGPSFVLICSGRGIWGVLFRSSSQDFGGLDGRGKLLFSAG